jgi:hypothetical protein
MKLNGWLRLWLVASALWLAGVGAFAYFDLSSLLAKKEWEVSKEGIGSAKFVFPESDPKDFVRRYINEELIPLITKDPATYVGKTTTKYYDAHVEKVLPPRIKQYAAAGLIPIILVLAIGWAIAWIRQGFSETRA